MNCQPYELSSFSSQKFWDDKVRDQNEFLHSLYYIRPLLFKTLKKALFMKVWGALHQVNQGRGAWAPRFLVNLGSGGKLAENVLRTIHGSIFQFI